jgi:hypothetical protein
MSTTAPPTAIPAIAPVGSALEDPPVALGMARVGVRDATAAFSLKNTDKSPDPPSYPVTGAVTVAPPEELEKFSRLRLNGNVEHVRPPNY